MYDCEVMASILVHPCKFLCCNHLPSACLPFSLSTCQSPLDLATFLSSSRHHLFFLSFFLGDRSAADGSWYDVTDAKDGALESMSPHDAADRASLAVRSVL